MNVEAVTFMKKIVVGMFLMGLCSMSAFAHVRRPPVAMPEPTGLVELGACAVGLGTYALRRRKTSV
jgi:hypothetical protein